MRIVLAYITVTGGQRTDLYAARMASSYNAFPPGIEHETLIVCNGGLCSHQTGFILSGLPCPRIFPRSNDGWDIGGYIEVALRAVMGADMLLCLGESVYFHRAGWLKRLVEAWEAYGEGMYGFFSSSVIRSHMNTTAFATSPKLLAEYPRLVFTKQDRYNFEHGPFAFWRLLARKQKPTMLVTWDGVWLPHQWRSPANILWRGDQSNCLMWCNHVTKYTEATPRVKAIWERWANQPFA